MKRVLILATMMMAMTLGLQAQRPARVPAYPGMIEREQPNGDKVETYLRGDEHKLWLMTVDKWQLIENAKGWLVYAKLNKNGVAVASCKKAHNEGQRSKCEKRWLNKHGIKLDK